MPNFRLTRVARIIFHYVETEKNPDGFYEMAEVCRPFDDRKIEDGMFYIDAKPPQNEVVARNVDLFDMEKKERSIEENIERKNRMIGVVIPCVKDFGGINDPYGDPVEFSQENLGELLREDQEFYEAAFVAVLTVWNAQTKVRVRKLDDTKN
jgi:hypothetical protein